MEANKPAAAATPAPPAPPPPVSAPKSVLEAYTFRKIGFPYLRQSMTAFGVSLLVSVALVGAGRIVLNRTLPVTEAARQTELAARERVIDAETKRSEISEYLTRFEELRARGFFGPESRLAMLEAIHAIQKARQLYPVTFEFAPQQTVAVDPALLTEPLVLHSTAVRLQMPMLHELDLVHLLHDLKQRGFFTVKDCVVNRASTAPTERGAARLNADCTLYWLSVDNPVAADPNAAQPAPEGT